MVLLCFQYRGMFLLVALLEEEKEHVMEGCGRALRISLGCCMSLGLCCGQAFLKLLSKTSLEKVCTIFVLGPGGGDRFPSMNIILFIGMYVRLLNSWVRDCMLRLVVPWNIMSRFVCLCGGMGYVILGEYSCFG